MSPRKHHNGFTGLAIDDGKAMFSADRDARSVSRDLAVRPSQLDFTHRKSILREKKA